MRGGGGGKTRGGDTNVLATCRVDRTSWGEGCAGCGQLDLMSVITSAFHSAPLNRAVVLVRG